jgi:hypothetical protein
MHYDPAVRAVIVFTVELISLQPSEDLDYA